MNLDFSKLFDGQLSSLNPTILLSADYSQVFERVREVVVNPQSDLLVAVLLFVMVSTVVLILLIVILIAILGAPEDEMEAAAIAEYTNQLQDKALKDAQSAQDTVDSQLEVEIIKEDTIFTAKRYINLLIGTLFVLAVWLLLGWSTAQNDICLSCHTQLVHPSTPENPHAGTRCVACHDGNQGFNIYILGTLSRSAHFMRGVGVKPLEEYGSVGTNSCVKCHPGVSRGIVARKATGVRVSHKEPLDAGMDCVDCHTSRKGIVSLQTAGMRNCLSCHNNTEASATCTMCHSRDVSYASVGDESETRSLARRIIPTPDCGGCHNMARECDPCHNGVKMPHSQDFMASGHAKTAVRDYWYGNGTLCVKCHNAQRRPCTSCHQTEIGSHGKSFAKDHQYADPSGGACRNCHDSNTLGVLAGRNLCVDVCHYDGNK